MPARSRESADPVRIGSRPEVQLGGNERAVARLAAHHPLLRSDLNKSNASAGLVFLCTTALIAAIIAFGASDWKMLRPMSTPAAPPCTALWAMVSASSSGSFLPPAITIGTGQEAVTVSNPSGT